jgi:hypothetical protein
MGHDPGDTLEEMLALAHRRLKIASAAGGDRLCVSDEKNQVNAVEETVIEQPSLDRALEMLANKEIGQLQPYAVQLALSALPLLEFCNEKFSLDLEIEIDTLKDRLTRV